MPKRNPKARLLRRRTRGDSAGPPAAASSAGVRLRPDEVFTPGKIPLGEHNIYISREPAERAIRRSLSRNWCPVIYGDYGVGKTTVVLRYFAEHQAAGQLVYVDTAASLTLPRLFERCLEYLNYSVEVERTTSVSAELEASFDTSVLRVGSKIAEEGTSKTQFTVTAPTDPAIIMIMNDARLSVVIDEMHRATAEFRSDLAAFIKSTRVSAPDMDLIFVGTSGDALQLVSSDPGIDRFVKDTYVPLMSAGESSALITNGFGKLGISVSGAVKQLLIEVSAGAPSILQSLCLDAAENVVYAGDREVKRHHLVTAIQQYISDNSGRMLRRYYGAIETQGVKRYRKQILLAAAMHSNDYVTMEDLRNSIRDTIGDVPASALSGPLRALKTPEYGDILRDVERSGGSGERLQNVTSFTDPMMKSFVRFMTTLDRTALLPEAEGRELAESTPESGES